MLGVPGPLGRLLRCRPMWQFAGSRHPPREGGLARRSALAPLRGSAAASTFIGATILIGASGVARADGVIAGGDLVPIEQRVAIAVGADRTTTWSSLRFDGPGGTVALVVPVKAGSALDHTSRAFFEALEEATAVRVVPPDQKPAVCAGGAPEATFSVEGDLEGLAPLEPIEHIVLPSSVDVQAWAAQQGLLVDPALVSGMNALDPAYSFAVLRYTAPPGPQVTRTFRAVAPGSTPTLPFVLSVAGNADLRVTAWMLGTERARLSGMEVSIDPDSLAFEAGDDTSNYRDLIGSALSDPSRYVVEAASHFALASSASLFDGTASIPAVIDAYFARAAQAGEVTGAPAECTFKAATALAQSAAFGLACPAGALGSVGPATPCTALPGAVDTAAVTCGGSSDDLAIAFSEIVANDTWVTRVVLRVPAHQSGLDAAVTFGPGAPVDPILEAAKVDETACGSSGSSTGSGPPPSSSGGGTVEVPVYQHEGCDCSGNYVLIGYEDVEDTGGELPDAYYDDGSDSCSGDTDGYYTNDPGDDCAYDPGDSTDATGCDCSSDADAGACDAGDDFGDDCAGDAGGDSCDSGGADACDSGAGDACSGFDADCAVGIRREGDPRATARLQGRPGGARKVARKPRISMSPFFYGLVLLLVPLRRRGRPTSAAPRIRTLFRKARVLVSGRAHGA